MIVIPLWLRSSILVLVIIRLIMLYIKHIDSNEHSVILSICTLFLFDVIISIGLSVTMLSYTVKGSFLVIHHKIPLEYFRWAYFCWVWKKKLRKDMDPMTDDEANAILLSWINVESLFSSRPPYTHDMDASDISREAIKSANEYLRWAKFVSRVGMYAAGIYNGLWLLYKLWQYW